jgi:hypothetical protein
VAYACHCTPVCTLCHLTLPPPRQSYNSSHINCGSLDSWITNFSL